MNSTKLLLPVLRMVVCGLFCFAGFAGRVHAQTTLESRVDVRFAEANSLEIPDFQKHVSPLLGRVGCNGRACHGSFQGKGGMRLSLFGYDFVADHAALMADGTGRVDKVDPDESLILAKPTDADFHEGGKKFEVGSWQYNLLKAWIVSGAKPVEQPLELKRLQVVPDEISFETSKQTVRLQVIAHWADGSQEDVTPLARFQSNDPQIAEVAADGLVTSDGFGDSHLVVFYDNGVTPIPVMRPYPKEKLRQVVNQPIDETRIDHLVSEKLAKLNLQRSDLADDVTFLRRVSLDIAGTLPCPDDIRAFLADPSPNKRERKIDQLLDSPAYAAWWTTFLCDITGNNSQELKELSLGSDPAQQWYDWIRYRVQKNVPYDQIVEGIAISKSRQGDETYAQYCAYMSEMTKSKSSDDFVARPDMPYYWMRRENQDRQTRAIAFAQNFLGLQIQCAQCHKHPFDRWTQKDFDEFSRFFTGVEYIKGRGVTPEDQADFREILAKLSIDPNSKGGQLQKQIAEAVQKGSVVPFPQLLVTKPKLSKEERKAMAKNDASKGKQNRGPLYYTEGRILGSDTVSFKGVEDIRQPLMEWTRNPDNPYFAKAFVNRVWAKYFGKGIVNPVDDLNPANPPSNAELLDYLAKGFVEHKFDMKWLHREIANSRTYQSSWIPNDSNAGDERNFSRAIPRRIPAELVVDAVAQACANDLENQSFLINVDSRAIAVAGTANARAMQRNRNYGFVFEAFGRSTRSNNCDCDRSNETSLIQTVYLQNDRDIHNLIDQPEGWIGKMFPVPGAQQNRGDLMTMVNATNKQLERLEEIRKGLSPVTDQIRIKRIDNRMEALRVQLTNVQSKLGTLDQPITALEPPQIIDEAYLRTLSRLPDEKEIARCMVHFADTADPRAGLAGVMWALINTKEFIVNH